MNSYKIKRWLSLTTLIFCFSCDFVYSQTKIKGITPLHEFFRTHADTTIILQYESSWLRTPEYFIISKKGDTISSYTYKALPKIDKRIILPRAIGYKLNQRNKSDMFNTPVDINLYFNPKYLSPDTLIQFWASIMKFSPWRIKDESVDGNGCPLPQGNNKNKKFIEDGGRIILDLITTDGSKRLNFYAPEFFEEVCPGRTGRKSAIEISKLFKTYFKEDIGQ